MPGVERQRAARSRSSSITVSRPQAASNGRVRAPRPGTDLDQRLAGLRIDLADDAVDDGAIDQEVLAEALAGAVGHGGRLGWPAPGYCGGSRSST